MQVLWELPLPSSGRTKGPHLGVEPGRVHTLTFEGEDIEGMLHTIELMFSDVKAFKCSYLHALSAEMIQSSYDRLVELGDSDWLKEVRKEAAPHRSSESLRHLRICFDDGPCYEFICTEYQIRSQSKA